MQYLKETFDAYGMSAGYFDETSKETPDHIKQYQNPQLAYTLPDETKHLAVNYRHFSQLARPFTEVFAEKDFSENELVAVCQGNIECTQGNSPEDDDDGRRYFLGYKHRKGIDFAVECVVPLTAPFCVAQLIRQTHLEACANCYLAAFNCIDVKSVRMGVFASKDVVKGQEVIVWVDYTDI